jgi:hypothetical protein
MADGEKPKAVGTTKYSKYAKPGGKHSTFNIEPCPLIPAFFPSGGEGVRRRDEGEFGFEPRNTLPPANKAKMEDGGWPETECRWNHEILERHETGGGETFNAQHSTLNIQLRNGQGSMVFLNLVAAEVTRLKL